jgi:hypothetical protein
MKTSSNNCSKHGSLKTLNNTSFKVLRTNNVKIHVQLASTHTRLKYISQGNCYNFVYSQIKRKLFSKCLGCVNRTHNFSKPYNKICYFYYYYSITLLLSQDSYLLDFILLITYKSDFNKFLVSFHISYNSAFIRHLRHA